MKPILPYNEYFIGNKISKSDLMEEIDWLIHSKENILNKEGRTKAERHFLENELEVLRKSRSLIDLDFHYQAKKRDEALWKAECVSGDKN